ncbi:Hypothetical predicted protein, partial [Pelobates cultripes]
CYSSQFVSSFVSCVVNSVSNQPIRLRQLHPLERGNLVGVGYKKRGKKVKGAAHSAREEHAPSYSESNSILREFFAMRCHVELPVTNMRECESDNTKFNTSAPHSHLRPCNTGEEK